MDQENRPSGFRFGFGFMFGVLAFLVFLPMATCAGCFSCAACINSVPSASSRALNNDLPPLPRGPSPLELEQEAYKANVEVKKVRLGEAMDGELSVFGEVKNKGTKSIKRLQLQVQCLDKAGKTIFEKDFLLLNTEALFAMNGEDKPLKPNFSRKFGIGLGDVPMDEWSRKVNVVVKELQFE